MKADAPLGSVWATMNTQQTNENLIVESIYLPPDADQMKSTILLSDILPQKQFTHKNVALLGDLNINWNSSSGEKHHTAGIFLSIAQFIFFHAKCFLLN